MFGLNIKAVLLGLALSTLAAIEKRIAVNKQDSVHLFGRNYNISINGASVQTKPDTAINIEANFFSDLETVAVELAALQPVSFYASLPQLPDQPTEYFLVTVDIVAA